MYRLEEWSSVETMEGKEEIIKYDEYEERNN